MSKRIALLINDDTLVKYGEANNVLKTFVKELTHQLENEADIKFLEVAPDKNIEIEQILYIIKRAHFYPSSGFMREVGKHWNDIGFSNWLKKEMKKKPV